ncbi:hypothetical protein HA402_012797 [Bradysia odoriphaga]|nr:hypothetical protein HA402_012797 [Bradysia odoriphaga]
MASEEFLKWLNNKLRELKTDESVYGSYIIGILDGDEEIAEKKEALEEILSQIIEDDIETILQTIIDKWEQCSPKVEEQPKVVEDVDSKLAKLMESNNIPATVTRQQYTAEELRIREQILAQYSQVELDECEDDDDVGGGSGGGGGPATTTSDPMIKNTNASDVAQLAKERREQAKLDSKAKKDKDKEDREKQKQMREEKKEKRKTVKGERRR